MGERQMTKIPHPPLGVLLLVIAACGGGSSENATERGAAAGAAGGAGANGARPPFELAKAPDDPCQWLSADEVQAILGGFSAPPVRVRPGQDPSPDPYGTGCLYTLALQPRMGKGTVVLSVALQR